MRDFYTREEMIPWKSIYTVLARPMAYRLFIRAVVGEGYRIYMRDYVKAQPGEKLLDIGCGPGDMLNELPAVEYVGFDVNPAYIDAAKAQFSARGRFFLGDVGVTALEVEKGTFDLALATGVVHHLEDERALRLFQLAYRCLKPGGRLITYDGCIVEGQSSLARWMVQHDRGRYVRPLETYLNLARSVFPLVEHAIRHDLLRIPYTHLILRCVK